MIQLSHSTAEIRSEIIISGSKSESNRWLILQHLYPESIEIQNLSSSEDTKVLQDALNSDFSSDNSRIDIGHAGTAMRFLTAFLAVQDGVQIILTGSERMQQRPIAPLVEALKDLGCSIEYKGKIGFPPLKISGQKIKKDEVTVRADISSQFITALMLIAPKLPRGLKINFKGELTSRPYVEMTLNQLRSLGIQAEFTPKGIHIFPKSIIKKKNVIVESDWSTASYWFSAVALAQMAEIKLNFFQKNSLQGDAAVREIYAKYFGVKSEITHNNLILNKIQDFVLPKKIHLNLNQTPDIAQTIAVTCAGLQIQAKLTGLKTLKIKETNRLLALQNELKKMGVDSIIGDDFIELISFNPPHETPLIETYQDHRMAMSFAPLALKFLLKIADENVVAKSCPEFWDDFASAGFRISH